MIVGKKKQDRNRSSDFIINVKQILVQNIMMHLSPTERYNMSQVRLGILHTAISYF